MPNTICYTWDKITKEYKFQDVCQNDPLDGGVLLPASSTLTAPPSSIDDGKAIVWESNAWVQKNDYRNRDAFNGQKMVTVDFIGDLPDGWSFEAPTE